jgi:spore maturation protein CgeB
MEAKKIMVVLPGKGGSRSLGENLVFALNSMGHKAIVFDCGKYKEAFSRMTTGDNNLVIDLYNQSLVVRALEEKVDAVLVIALAPITAFTIQMLKNAGIKTLHYFCEDLRSEEFWKPVIKVYDYFFIIQKDPWLKEVKKLNRHTYYIPNGAPLEYVGAGSAPREHDVVFVGAPYQNRIQFFEKLSKMRLNFLVWGWGWDKFPLSPELKKRVVSGTRWLGQDEIFSIYSRAKIVLNLHSTLTGAEIDVSGDFVNPRAFIVPLAQTLQIADRRQALFEFFTEDKEIVCFSTAQELTGKIQYFLSHPDHADIIIEAAHKKIEAGHLLSHRLTQILEIVFPEKETETLKNYVDQAKSKMENKAELDDEDLVYLLAEDVLIRRSGEEAG